MMLKPAVVALVALTAVGLVAWIDFVTGVEIRLFPLYFLPVAFASWYGHGRWGLIVSGASGIVWMAANLLAGKQYSSSWIWGVNTAAQTVAFATVALLLDALYRRLAFEEQLARTDALTGLLNRHAFYESAARELELARSRGLVTTVACLDLDAFKSVNDRDGHARGDDVLREIAESLRAEARTGDLLCRMGGDEFAVLLPKTDLAGAEVMLQRLCAKVAASMAAQGLPVTVSVGAAICRLPPRHLEAAVGLADRLLYRAKANGKSRVELEATTFDELAESGDRVSRRPGPGTSAIVSGG
jgi:diguanylate cyclase (GGDEF)-like protein